jgi:TetR/AcrR family transcriptional regulator, cholesterol catabolism regulator
MTTEVETKDLLLEVAIDLFASKGYAATSIRDIANGMRMSISNIYHYYGSKEGILLAIFEQSAVRLYEDLEQVAESDVEPVERFARLVRTNLTHSGRFRNEARIYTIEREQYPPQAQERVRQLQRQILDIYVGQLRGLSEQGLLAQGDVTVLAFNVLAVINWPLRWFREGGALSFDQIAEEVVRFVLRGCLKPEAINRLYPKEGWS